MRQRSSLYITRSPGAVSASGGGLLLLCPSSGPWYTRRSRIVALCLPAEPCFNSVMVLLPLLFSSFLFSLVGWVLQSRKAAELGSGSPSWKHMVVKASNFAARHPHPHREAIPFDWRSHTHSCKCAALHPEAEQIFSASVPPTAQLARSGNAVGGAITLTADGQASGWSLTKATSSAWINPGAAQRSGPQGVGIASFVHAQCAACTTICPRGLCALQSKHAFLYSKFNRWCLASLNRMI